MIDYIFLPRTVYEKIKHRKSLVSLFLYYAHKAQKQNQNIIEVKSPEIIKTLDCSRAIFTVGNRELSQLGIIKRLDRNSIQILCNLKPKNQQDVRKNYIAIPVYQFQAFANCKEVIHLLVYLHSKATRENTRVLLDYTKDIQKKIKIFSYRKVGHSLKKLKEAGFVEISYKVINDWLKRLIIIKDTYTYTQQEPVTFGIYRVGQVGWTN